MNKAAVSLLVSSLLLIPSGVGWIYPPAGVITAGLLMGVLGVLMLDTKVSK
ncbi:hypothetical protein [Prauserella endophytica]|uniref:hypothetical protein n=1 Tax=Prauserella endophytica TaxID=1592324 RepID=UPI00130546C7|nr:hypothetical protein [Prauserella endophytica]